MVARLVGAVLIGMVLTACADRDRVRGSAGLTPLSAGYAGWQPLHGATDSVPWSPRRGTLTPNQRLLLGFLFADAGPQEREAYARWAGARMSGIADFTDPVQHDRNSVQYQAAWHRFRAETVRQRNLLEAAVAEWEELKDRLDDGWK